MYFSVPINVWCIGSGGKDYYKYKSNPSLFDVLESKLRKEKEETKLTVLDRKEIKELDAEEKESESSESDSSEESENEPEQDD